ncbi:MAG: ribosomal protein S18-alanine N-acetyltransferase [Pyrinomonadaceae bacterium]
MVSPFSIEIIKEVDISDIIEIQTECRLSPWSYQDYQDEILRRDSASFTAKNKQTVIGFIIARLIIPENYNNYNNSFLKLEAEIYNLAVKPNFQQKGIGNLLLRQFIQKAKENQVNSIWLEVRESNQTALSFYKNNKFKEIYKRKNFYSHPPENATVMKLDISKPEFEIKDK